MSSSPFDQALAADDTLPLDPVVRRYWLMDLKNPLRRGLLPCLRVLCSLSLHLVYFTKRVLPIEFRAHRFLQRIICWFMKWFVRPEANYLILHHFGTESNLINFVIANSARKRDVAPADLYPSLIRDLMRDSFVRHDEALFRAVAGLGSTANEAWPVPAEHLDFSLLRPVCVEYHPSYRKLSQFLDFETAHELFKTTFCLLLTAREYEAAINSFQLDQTLAVRTARILGDPALAEYAHNRFPLVFHGTTGLSRRFVLHGLFVEHLHAHLVAVARRSGVELGAEPRGNAS